MGLNGLTWTDKNAHIPDQEEAFGGYRVPTEILWFIYFGGEVRVPTETCNISLFSFLGHTFPFGL